MARSPEFTLGIAVLLLYEMYDYLYVDKQLKSLKLHIFLDEFKKKMKLPVLRIAQNRTTKSKTITQ